MMYLNDFMRLRDYTTHCAWATIQPTAIGRQRDSYFLPWGC